MNIIQIYPYRLVPMTSKPTQMFPDMRIMTPLFSDNSRVYYKKGSLGSGGIGSIRNARAIMKMT